MGAGQGGAPHSVRARCSLPGKGGLEVAPSHADTHHHIRTELGVQRRGALLRRGDRVYERWQRIILHLQQLQSIFGEVAVLATTTATGCPT